MMDLATQNNNYSYGKNSETHPLLCTMDNHMAQKFLEHLAALLKNDGCVLVKNPKLCVSS